MMRFVGLLGFGLALAMAGCGGDDGVGGTNQAFACDIGSGTSTHACYEWSWTGPANAADSYKGVCASAGATTVSSCPSSGKVGGCKYTVTNSSVTVTWINWFYFGTAAEDMMGCVTSGQITATWVSP